MADLAIWLRVKYATDSGGYTLLAYPRIDLGTLPMGV